jgi:hypothetical protein
MKSSTGKGDALKKRRNPQIHPKQGMATPTRKATATVAPAAVNLYDLARKFYYISSLTLISPFLFALISYSYTSLQGSKK